MRRRLLLSLATIAVLSVACSPAPETIVAEGGASAETLEITTTVPGQRPTDQPSTALLPNDEQPNPEPAEEPPVLQQAKESTPTIATAIEPQPDPPETIESWRDHPLARVVPAADDLGALGLDASWEVRWADFIELDTTDHAEEEICGTEVPNQTSYFVASFEQRSSGMELDLNVMPATNGTTAIDYLNVLGLLATCPTLEEEFAAVSMEIVAIDVEGADQSIVITGTDATSPTEPIGLTLAAAEVDGHLFMAFVAQDDGTPASGDAELAVSAIELSISRL
jgi:hypothetical protein